ncbi:uncharacterized protein B0J16DRAFT_94680 [Fusarium flagelliforme]|uniref:uncharacterized protein n=1 Tax=Fusarium flagelliforme TaxID=2675880 RepID=UPI001E8DA24D|nr:uncharacterized protein B0J16DRAFT_94680 [Fusarium flagelliforme]KAH7188472.1 hypothetical protein B0J16DRAFT_94680 [Fusarium flagelliforme]
MWQPQFLQELRRFRRRGQWLGDQPDQGPRVQNFPQAVHQLAFMLLEYQRRLDFWCAQLLVHILIFCVGTIRIVIRLPQQAFHLRQRFTTLSGYILSLPGYILSLLPHIILVLAQRFAQYITVVLRVLNGITPMLRLIGLRVVPQRLPLPTDLVVLLIGLVLSGRFVLWVVVILGILFLQQPLVALVRRRLFRQHGDFA